MPVILVVTAAHTQITDRRWLFQKKIQWKKCQASYAQYQVKGSRGSK